MGAHAPSSGGSQTLVATGPVVVTMSELATWDTTGVEIVAPLAVDHLPLLVALSAYATGDWEARQATVIFGFDVGFFAPGLPWAIPAMASGSTETMFQAIQLVGYPAGVTDGNSYPSGTRALWLEQTGGGIYAFSGTNLSGFTDQTLTFNALYYDLHVPSFSTT